MNLVLKTGWDAIDGSSPNKSKVIITAGRHEVERIQNPFGHEDAPWLVLKGTKIGATEGFWRQWKGSEWNEYEVVIED